MQTRAWRRPFFALAALLVVLVAAYAAYWHITAKRLRNGLAPWAEAQRAHGYIVDWKEVAVDGFPDAFRFHFTAAHFGATRPLPTELTAPRLTVWAAPWNLRHWQFDAPDGAAFGGALDPLHFDLGTLQGSAQLGNSEALVLDVAATALKGQDLTQDLSIEAASAHIEVPPRPPANHQGTALEAGLQLTGLILPVSLPSFGNRVGELSFSAELKGALPPGPLPQALAAWRDDGGTVELRSLRLHWGTVLIDASGTLALDEALQPEGALSAEVTGQNEAVDLAVKSGALKPESGGIAKAILNLLAKPGLNGENAITVPVTVQQQRLFLGPAAIAALPRIDWE